MDTEQIILTRQLPKTGQTTSYTGGDDGHHEAGWWKGLLNADNKERFIAFTRAGHELVKDQATGLIWPKDFTGTGGGGGADYAWGICIDEANILSFGGFSDWRLPNALELLSIVNYERDLPAVHDIFDNVIQGNYWTSTTRVDATGLAYYVSFSGHGQLRYDSKSVEYYFVCVRAGL